MSHLLLQRRTLKQPEVAPAAVGQDQGRLLGLPMPAWAPLSHLHMPFHSAATSPDFWAVGIK